MGATGVGVGVVDAGVGVGGRATTGRVGGGPVLRGASGASRLLAGGRANMSRTMSRYSPIPIHLYQLQNLSIISEYSQVNLSYLSINFLKALFSLIFK